jgi:undecaprenyl-diphosphatase
MSEQTATINRQKHPKFKANSPIHDSHPLSTRVVGELTETFCRNPSANSASRHGEINLPPMLFIVMVVLGIVEGITEFLPISSTGHLILTGHLLGFTGPKADCFEVFIQFGAILAVVFMYRERFLALWPWQWPGSKSTTAPELAPAIQSRFAGWSGLTLLAAVTVPGLIMGKLLHGTIKEHLFNPQTVAIGLGVGGILILLVEKFGPRPGKTDVHEVTVKDAFIIGCFQCLALWPGMSRASSTILGGMLLRFDRKTAAEFSFLAAVPLISAAAIYDLYKNWNILELNDAWFFAGGFLTAFASAWLAVRFFMRYLARHTLVVFGYYRIVLALVAWWVFA